MLYGATLYSYGTMNWFESLIQPILSIIAENVYPGVFIAAFLETILPPIPSEIVFPLAGYSILTAQMAWPHIIGVGVAGGSGATLGAYIIFLVAKKVGRPGLLKYMRRIRLTESKLLRAERWFAKYGDKSVLIGRCIPAVRELVSIPAGILNMNSVKFLLYTFAGSCAWSTGLTAVGYYFGVATL